MNRINWMIATLFVIFPHIPLVAQSQGQMQDQQAQVIATRNHATELLPRAHDATVIQTGSILEEDTSIVTGPNSFVSLQTPAGNIISIGPETKIVLHQLSQEQGDIIGLFKGEIRIQGKKMISVEQKLTAVIKTKTAAMGMDHGSAHFAYHLTNDIATVLVYEGKVKFAKLPKITGSFQDRPGHSEDENQLEREKFLRLKNEGPSLLSDFQEIFSLPSTVSVLAGQFSYAVPRLPKASLPVKISPLQFEVLAKNEEFERPLPGANNFNTSKIVITHTQLDQLAPLGGVGDPKSGDFAPRAGGLLDWETGLYFAPSDTAVLDPKAQVYRFDSNGGKFCSKSGQYFPPAGIVLNPKQGFWADEALASKQKLEPQEVEKLLLQMSNSVNQEIVFGRKTDIVLSVYAMKPAEILGNNTISIGGGMLQQDLSIGKTSQTPAQQFAATSGQQYRFEWHHASGGRWQLTNTLFLKKLGLKNGESTVPAQYLFTLNAGLRRVFGTRWFFLVNGQLAQDFYFLNADPSVSAMVITTAQLTAAWQWRFFTLKRFFFDATFGLRYLLPTTKAQTHSHSGYAFPMSLSANYWHTTDAWLRFEYQHHVSKVEVDGGGISIPHARVEGGWLLSYGWQY